MRSRTVLAWIIIGCTAAAGPVLCAQAQPSSKDKEQPAKNQQPANAQQQPSNSQPNGNPFPEDVNSVPVMPNGNEPDAADDAGLANSPDAAPHDDSDPVRSPEQDTPFENGATDTFSSSRHGLDNIVPDPNTDTEPAGTKKGKGKNDDSLYDRMPRESAVKDIEVGNYYMDNKNWRGALSRFQSALVLAPENPDVYWGLAECQRRLGQFADARANYEKVVTYDPDSKHGKDAKKALKDPDLANAKPPQK